jgi:hypothetical protein
MLRMRTFRFWLNNNMGIARPRYFIALLCSLTIFVLSACGGSDTSSETLSPVVVPTQTAEITNFSFSLSSNPALSQNIQLQISGNTISGRVPNNVPVSALVATFEHGGNEVKANNVLQVSNQSANDFTQIQTYTVTTNDGKSQTYSVDIVKFTGLPIVHLSTQGNVNITSKDDYIDGEVWVDGGRNYVELVSVPMEIRGRGNSTWGHPKKPYQMKLADKAEFLGMPEDKKWLFLAEYSDKTMLRNSIAFEMGYMSNLAWTPQSTFSEVYLNDEYIGTYNITQKVEESDNRLPLDNGGFLLEIDQYERLDPDDVYFNTKHFLINIKEPSVDWGSSELSQISELINDFEGALFAASFRQENVGYQQYIDIDSFIDWFIISEITKNVDSRDFSSIFLHVLPGEKIRMGPLWDFDLSFGNVDYANSRYAEGYWVKEHKWYTRLFQDPAFVDLVQTRFAFFRNNQGLILDKIDKYAERLKWAQQENDERWQTIGIYVWPNPVVFDTYDQEVDHMKDWYIQRMDWLHEALNSL